MKRPICPHFCPTSPTPYLCASYPVAPPAVRGGQAPGTPPIVGGALAGAAPEELPPLYSRTTGTAAPELLPPVSSSSLSRISSASPVRLRPSSAARGSRHRLGRDGRTSHDPESDPRCGEMEVRHPWRFCGSNRFIFCLSCLPALIF